MELDRRKVSYLNIWTILEENVVVTFLGESSYSLPDRSLCVYRAELAAAEKTLLPSNPTDNSLISQSLSHAISRFHLNSDHYIRF